MKLSFLGLCIALLTLGITANAQVTINNTSCADVTLVIYATDLNNTTCGSYVSDPITVNNGASFTLTHADLTWGGNPLTFSGGDFDYVVVSNARGVTGIPGGGCPFEDVVTVGSGTCSFPSTDCFEVATTPTGSCAVGTVVNATYTNNGPYDITIDIF